MSARPERPEPDDSSIRVRLIGAHEGQAGTLEALLSASLSCRFEILQTTPSVTPEEADVVIVCHRGSVACRSAQSPRIERPASGLPWILLSDEADELLAAQVLELGACVVLSLEARDTVHLVSALRAAVKGERQLRALREERDRDRRLANQDQPTALANRHIFKDRLGQAMASARRSGKKLAVLFVDIDDFKVVNDTLGHSAGDELLVNVAGMLRGLLRESDTAARIGGDEFALLLNHMSDELDAAIVARKILDALSEPMLLKGRPVHCCSVSIGIATVPSDGQAPLA